MFDDSKIDGTSRVTRLRVEGMSCTHCQASVQGALERVEGVEAVEVDLAAGRATVRGRVEPDRLVAAVAAEGYRAAPASS